MQRHSTVLPNRSLGSDKDSGVAKGSSSANDGPGGLITEVHSI